MGKSKTVFLILLALACALVSLFGCEDTTETESQFQETETQTGIVLDPHDHDYKLSRTVEGTCAEWGYHLFACECGLSYKELIPSSHVYTEKIDTTGKYLKKVCTRCGDYKIVRKVEYIYCIDFEDAKTVEDAADQSPKVSFYAAVGAGSSIASDAEGSYGVFNSSNYYLLDASGVMKSTVASGKKFVLSMDVKYDKYNNSSLLSIIYLNSGNSWNYNDGLVRVDRNGKLSFFGAGDSKYSKEITLSDKGYSNITVVGDLKTCTFDVYVDEVLVRKGIQYYSPAKNLEKVYVRYLDRDKGAIASLDDLKFYLADSPEFVVPSSGIQFVD